MTPGTPCPSVCEWGSQCTIITEFINKGQETGTTTQSNPYLRRLESLTSCRGNYKGSNLLGSYFNPEASVSDTLYYFTLSIKPEDFAHE